MIEFNVNGYVFIKLNKEGMHELERQHLKLSKMFPNVGEFRPPTVNQDGYSKWQLHDLMNTFGHMMALGGICPFETSILIDANCND